MDCGLALDDASFRQIFAGSPIKRIGRDRMVRNAAIVAGNSGETSLADRLQSLLDDPAPAVRGAAVWALGRLGMLDAMRADAEQDETVLGEWTAALSACRSP